MKIFSIVLLGLASLYLAAYASLDIASLQSAGSIDAALRASWIGGDFVNLRAAAELVLSGRIGEIYVPDAFMAFEKHLIPQDIGQRLWAYPPQSLLVLWPFGFGGFGLSYIAWSLVGLVVLALGARRLGFTWLEIAILVISPAAIECVHFGQTGNLTAGLLMLALAAPRGRAVGSVVAAALLTIKPQLGTLLPVVWLIRGQWRLIAATAVVVVLFCGMSLAVFGVGAWGDYLTKSLRALDQLERFGSGPFLDMIPSVFIAVRVLGGSDGVAGLSHLVVAIPTFSFVAWALWRRTDAAQQNATVLVGAMLITPYVHVYDLVPLLAAGMLTARLWRDASLPRQLVVYAIVIANGALPILTFIFNDAGLPLSPLLMLALLAAASAPASFRRAKAVEAPEADEAAWRPEPKQPSP